MALRIHMRKRSAIPNDYVVFLQEYEVDIRDYDGVGCAFQSQKFIYRLKQTYQQLYFKFDKVIILFGFEMNLIDDCIYHKFSGSEYMLLVLHIDDILLASNSMDFFHETMRLLAKNLDMNDFGNAADTTMTNRDKFSLNQMP
ncbi:hypothetical protein CR513_48663, partial [Mucuna pruriens]